jgi:hypothetical protein
MLLLSALASSRATADTTHATETVILLQPTTASPALRRSFARIRNELVSDRVRVIVADSPRLRVLLGEASTAGDPGLVLDRAADETALLALLGDPETGEAELCIVQLAAPRVAVRRATVAVEDPELMPDALAARALELLRATALELSIEMEHAPRSQERPQSPPNVVSPPSMPPAAAQPEAAFVAIDMGLGLWNSIDGPPPAATPVGRIGVRLSDRTWARLSVAGWGSRPRVDTTYGSAVLSQSVALAELAAVFRRDKRVRPALSLGAGVVRVDVAGTGAAPYEGREPQRWSAAFDGGVGVAVAIGSHAAVVAELHALLASPHPVVRFIDTRAATIGYPSLMPTLALQVTP